jgi:uncharacterized membrane protein
MIISKPSSLFIPIFFFVIVLAVVLGLKIHQDQIEQQQLQEVIQRNNRAMDNFAQKRKQPDPNPLY